MRDEGESERATHSDAAEQTLMAPGTTRASDSDRSRPQRPAPEPVAPRADYAALVTVDREHYSIIRELARGGMGRILEARDHRLARGVAIKEVLHDDQTSHARFEREARITARLQHPNIVHLYEAGRWPTGQPFYAMKLIHGKPLDKHIAAATGLASRLELLPAVIAAVDALAFAHSAGVIHRDLKPANILVGDFGETVVIDWGIAKDLTAEEADDLTIGPYRDVSVNRKGPESSRDQTVEGAIIGTPAYMPPEQAAGERVDERADVYALGALLYQVLAGAPPYDGRTTVDVLDRVLAGPPQPLAEREPDVPTELVAIVGKAMARTPAERFPTAKEMAAELKRFANGQLVTSHQYTRWELVKRWVRRYRTAVAVGTVALITVAVLASVGLWRIVVEQKRADHKQAVAEERGNHDRVTSARAALAADPTTALAPLKTITAGAAEWRDARMVAAEAASYGVSDVLTGEAIAAELAFTMDGTRLAALEASTNTVRVWDLASRTQRSFNVDPTITTIAIAVDGSVVGLAEDGTVARWDSRGIRRVLRTIPGEIGWAAISPDARRIIILASQSPSLLVDLAGEDHELPQYRVAAWSPDGASLIAYAIDNNRIDRIDAATGTVTTVRTDVTAHSLATDGKRMWASVYDRDHSRDDPWRLLMELASGTEVRTSATVGHLVALPGGRVASATSPQTIHTDTLWGREAMGRAVRIDPGYVTTRHNVMITDGNSTVELRGQVHTVAVAAARDGALASSANDGTIRIWHPPVVERVYPDAKISVGRAILVAAPGGKRELVMTRLGPRLEIVDLATGASRFVDVGEFPVGHPPPASGRYAIRMFDVGGRRFAERVDSDQTEDVIELVASASRRRLVTLDSGHQAIYWDLDAARGRLLATDVTHAALSPDGTRVALARTQRKLDVWNATTGITTPLGEAAVTALAYAQDNTLAIATQHPSVFLFGPDLRRRALETDGTQVYRSLAFSPDGKTIVAGGHQWTVRTIDVATGDRQTYAGHGGIVTDVMFLPDGRVATAATDLTVRVWSFSPGHAALSTELRGHTGLITSLELGPDDTLVTASEDGTARIWDLRSAQSRPLLGHVSAVYASYTDEAHVVVVDRLHQRATHPDDLPRDEAGLRQWLARATNLTK